MDAVRQKGNEDREAETVNDLHLYRCTDEE
jgi:hypothetical protein